MELTDKSQSQSSGNHPEGFPKLTVNARVRFRSENPEREPQATIIEVGYLGVRLAWDDGHHHTTVLSHRLSQLEAL